VFDTIVLSYCQRTSQHRRITIASSAVHAACSVDFIIFVSILSSSCREYYSIILMASRDSASVGYGWCFGGGELIIPGCYYFHV
jgi:hypothetical protein